MSAMVVPEHGKAPVLSEVADPAGPTADVLAASLNPVDVAVAAGLNPFRRPEPPLVLGLDGMARRADGTLVILDTLWGPAIPAAVEAAARGARVVHLGNSAGALATLAGPALRTNGISILAYAIFTSSARERSDAFARLAQHAAAGELTVEYRETGLEALPAIWDDFAAGRPQTKIIVTPDEATPS